MNVDKDGCELPPLPHSQHRTCQSCKWTGASVTLLRPDYPICPDCEETL